MRESQASCITADDGIDGETMVKLLYTCFDSHHHRDPIENTTYGVLMKRT